MSNGIIGKLADYNTRFFIGSIEDGNGIEVSAVVEECILKKVKFRCFGCDSLCSTTCNFLKQLIGQDLSKIDLDHRSSSYIGCICPRNIILCKLLDKEVNCCGKSNVYLFDGILRYDVENMILLKDIFTIDRVRELFNIAEINREQNLRILKILKRVIEAYKATYIESE